jgi:hypothetical protein
MRLYTWDLPALFVFAVAAALQMMWFVFVVQTTGNPLISGLLPVLFLT